MGSGHDRYDGYEESHEVPFFFLLSLGFSRMNLFGREELPVMRQSRGQSGFLASLILNHPKYADGTLYRQKPWHWRLGA
jgi:hypothetical protein